MTPLRRAASFGLLALACATSPQSPRAAVTRTPSLPSSTPPRVAAVPAAPALELVPLTALAPLASAHVEVDSPAFGDVVARDFWRRELVRVRFSASEPSARVLVAVDGQRPRWLPEAGVLTLGELVPEQNELAIGAHELLAVLVSAGGRALRGAGEQAAHLIVDFFVGERRGKVPASGAARLFCLGPWGTHYVSAASPLTLELLPVGAVAAELPLRTTAAHTHARFEQTIDPRRAYVIERPPLGDLQLRIGNDDGPHADCDVTVNPEPAAR